MKSNLELDCNQSFSDVWIGSNQATEKPLNTLVKMF